MPLVVAGVTDLDAVRPHCKTGSSERGNTVDQCHGADVLARVDKRDGAGGRSIASSQGRAQGDCLAECRGVGGGCQLDSCRLARENIQNRTCGLAGSIDRVTVEDGDVSVNAGSEGTRGEGRGIAHEWQGSDDRIGWKADKVEKIDGAGGLTAGGCFGNGECDRNTGLDVTRREAGKVGGCLQRRSNNLSVVQENLGGVLAYSVVTRSLRPSPSRSVRTVAELFQAGAVSPTSSEVGVRKVPSPLPGKMRNVFPPSVAMTSGVPSPSISPTATVSR